MNAKLFHFLFRNYDEMNKKKTIGINRRTLTVKIFMVRMEKNIRSIMNCSKKKKDSESTCQKIMTPTTYTQIRDAIYWKYFYLKCISKMHNTYFVFCIQIPSSKKHCVWYLKYLQRFILHFSYSFQNAKTL